LANVVIDLTQIEIKEVQSLLNRLGYGKLAVDGIFGHRSSEALKKFQNANNLEADGILGAKTYAAVNNYLNGYYKYTIKKGDTFYKLAEENGIDYRLIKSANPNINAENLIVGTVIILPIAVSVVPTDMEYTYGMMLRNLRSFKVLYPFLNLGKSGNSSLGRGMYYFSMGIGSNEVFYNASHHSLEWITTPLLMKFAEDYLVSYVTDKIIAGTSIKNLYDRTKLTIMPMVNPDGVTLVLEGLTDDNPNYDNLIKWNNNSKDFSNTWQANNNGVDINHNYDAGFDEYKVIAEQLGYDKPGPTRYPGEFANSESETRSVVSLIMQNDFNLALAYHTQGEIIYWQYKNLADDKSKEIGEELAKVSGYTLDIAQGVSSYSGFKDWFISKYLKPGYTIEAGSGKNPLPISQFNEIYKVNVPLLIKAMEVTE